METNGSARLGALALAPLLVALDPGCTHYTYSAKTEEGRRCVAGCQGGDYSSAETQRCIDLCPGVIQVSTTPQWTLPCCKALGAVCGDSRCTCAPEKCGS